MTAGSAYYVARDDDKAGRTIEKIGITSTRGGEEDGHM
jgi:hypothetical protein